MTEREYLISLGLAKPGRGRFSAAGKEALAKAVKEGMTFAERGASPTTPAAPRAAKAKPAPKVKPEGAADPKAVRAWAKENGHAVGDRGRIRPEVINAYLAHCRGNDVKVVLPAENGAKDFRPTATPIHPRVWFKVQDEGRETLVTYRTACNECGYSLYHCPAPRVFAADGETLVAAVPTDKPVVNDGKFW